MKDPILEVDQLTVHYQKKPVLWEISFAAPKGKLVAIVGPNGAGKSTFLRSILGLVKPTSGNIFLSGTSVKSKRHKIAYVPQKDSVDWNFPINALDLVLMGHYGKLGLFRRPSKKDRKAALAALAKVGMEGYAKRQINEFSGGQKQRLFIARALMQEADIFFMDEPFSGIDIASEKTIMKVLTQLKGEGKSFFIVHHDLPAVKTSFDWVIFLNTRLIAQGPVEEVFTEENLLACWGENQTLFDEAFYLSKKKYLGSRE